MQVVALFELGVAARRSRSQNWIFLRGFCAGPLCELVRDGTLTLPCFLWFVYYQYCEIVLAQFIVMSISRNCSLEVDRHEHGEN